MKTLTVALAALAAAFVLGTPSVSEAAKAKKMTAADCLPFYTPVCVAKGKKKTQYANSCMAKVGGAKKWKDGLC